MIRVVLRLILAFGLLAAISIVPLAARTTNGQRETISIRVGGPGETPLLFGVHSVDPITFIVAPTLLALVAFLACCLPAWRVTKIDPLVALRYE